ncbi:hypothetical protein HS088_TW21G00066 [Tripterygium wilfordii]|uniref:Uncharacterized protein n=1 Tax=Tripterygium wilfordii TaxID=458696 RepID=A0A7J7C2C7_TRIWF|nr:hypothetical protein HS088_TW21G00066 [Tripterygium wilfordii]
MFSQQWSTSHCTTPRLIDCDRPTKDYFTIHGLWPMYETLERIDFVPPYNDTGCTEIEPMPTTKLIKSLSTSAHNSPYIPNLVDSYRPSGSHLEGGMRGLGFLRYNVAGSRVLASRASRMKAKLQSPLKAMLMEIEDVSYQHEGHATVRNANGGKETHFNTKIVSPKFEGQSLVKWHRMVYDTLNNELSSGLHALSIVAKTPLEAAKK